MKILSHQDNVESEAMMLVSVPSPLGGAIVIGQETILYNRLGAFFFNKRVSVLRDDNTYVTISPPNIHQTQFSCACRIDQEGQRFLVCDLLGRLFMLLLSIEENMEGRRIVTELKVLQHFLSKFVCAIDGVPW